MRLRKPQATKPPEVSARQFLFEPTNGPFSRPQKVPWVKKTRIQKRAVGILENSQTKSAIGIVEKDTVPALASWEGKGGCHLEGYHLEDSVEMGRKPNFRNTSLVSELPWVSETTMTLKHNVTNHRDGKEIKDISKHKNNQHPEINDLFVNLAIILSNSSDIDPPQNQ